MTDNARYLVIDAEGHSGYWVKVYRASTTPTHARKFIAGSPLFTVVRGSTKDRRGDYILRTDLAFYPKVAS